MSIRIVYGDESYFEGFFTVLESVAREKIFLEMIEPPAKEEVFDFQRRLLEKKAPVFYAVDGEKMVGWVDVVPFKNPRMSHRGTLGMGLMSGYRGQGVGSKLMEKAISYSRSFGLEKLELQVYPSNTQALELYKKFGFKQTGVVHKYRKLEGQYFDSICMELFL